MTQLTHSTHHAAPDGPKLIDDLFGLFGVLRRGWRLIAVTVLVSLTLAALYVVRLKPVYKGTARLLVLQQGGRPLSEMVGGRNTYGFEEFNDYLPTHISLIRSPVIIEKAIALSGQTHLRVDDVIGRLTVTRPEAAVKILEIGYQAATPDEATTIVAAVTESYKKFLEENYQKNSTDVIALMTKVRDELNKELKGLEQKYLEFHRQHPVFTVTDDGRSLLTRQLDQFDQEANQSLLKDVKLKEQYRLAEEMARQGEGIWAVANALKVLGGGIEIDGGSEDSSTLMSGSIEHLNTQLEETELKRGTVERLIAHLKAEHAKATAARAVSDEEVAEAFYSEPEAARLREQLSVARSKHDSARRVVRAGSDPTVLAARRRMNDLQAHLDDLWRARRPVLRDLLARDSSADLDAAIHRAESESIVLRATAGALRERLDQLNAGGDRENAAAPDAVTVALSGDGPAPAVSPTGSRSTGQLQSLLFALKRGLVANEKLGQEMRRRFEEKLSAAKDTEIDRLTEANLRAELGRSRDMYNSVVEQLKQARLVSDNTTITAQAVNPPSAAVVRPRLATILVAALVMGLALGVGLAFVADLLDARIRTLPEIRKALDLGVLGLIPQLGRDENSDGVTVGLISHAQPRSMIAESYKSLRTNLEFYRRSRSVQVLLFTSPQSGDGKSTSASNLAISLAHAGRKVLLVDADLRRPTQHLLHNLSRELGLVHILKNLLPIPRVVQPTVVENLDLISAGPEVANPAELLASPAFGEFLASVRQTYDAVVIDSSPLLAVTDPSIIGAAVDGIVLVVRATALRRHEAERTSELLKSLGTPLLGTVINGITREQSGYGYGYGYGYGSGYGYGTYGANGAAHSLEERGGPPSSDPPNGAVEHRVIE